MLVTHKENCNNPLSLINYSKGNLRISHFKSISQYTKNGEFIMNFESIKQASNMLNINCSSICACCKGKLKTSGGYIWKYS